MISNGPSGDNPPVANNAQPSISGGGTVQAGGHLKLVVTRPADSDSTHPMTVAYMLKGTAVAGVDYAPLPGTVTIPAGKATAKIKVTALDRPAGPVTLRLKLRGVVGAPGQSHGDLRAVIEQTIPILTPAVSSMTTSHLTAARTILAFTLCALAGCKPAPIPKATPEQTPGESSSQPRGDARRQPSAVELNNFLRGILPPVVKLVDFKSDVPVPMPNTAPGSNAWLVNVRLTIAATEDELAEAPPPHVQAFQAAENELAALAVWSLAYAESPYASLYPGFTVHLPQPAAPKLLTVVHPKDQPRAPVYGKLAAEWQVDHWQFSILEMPTPEAHGKFRAAFTGPVLVDGEPAAAQFLATTQAAIAEAKPKKAAIEAAYEADLVKATRPGTLYRGQVSVGSSVVAAEIRFLETVTADR